MGVRGTCQLYPLRFDVIHWLFVKVSLKCQPMLMLFDDKPLGRITGEVGVVE